jgi:hypothetical protein
MFAYKIMKKGRKWFEGVTTEKGYKAQIEINECSKDWAVGDVVEFEGKMERKTSGGYTKVYVFPCSAEQKKEQDELAKQKKEQAEIEKWLGYVEEHSGSYVYQNGVNTLRSMDLNDEQKARLNTAVKTGTINQLKNKTKDYIGYIKEKIGEGRWYSNGEVTVNDNIDKLEKLNIDVTGYKAELKNLKDSFIEKKHQQEKVDAERYFNVQRLSEYKGDEYSIGEIVPFHDGKLGKVIKTRKYYEEDTMSFGYMVDGGWILCAKCDTAAVTDAEREEFFRKQAEQQAAEQHRKEQRKKKAELEKTVKELFSYVRKNGTYPEKDENQNQVEVSGETIYDTFTIYGGGEKVIIDGERIWVLENNGGDGDNWSWNNIRTGGAGAIGHYMEMNEMCKQYIETIKNIKNELEE